MTKARWSSGYNVRYKHTMIQASWSSGYNVRYRHRMIHARWSGYNVKLHPSHPQTDHVNSFIFSVLLMKNKTVRIAQSTLPTQQSDRKCAWLFFSVPPGGLAVRTSWVVLARAPGARLTCTTPGRLGEPGGTCRDPEVRWGQRPEIHRGSLVSR